MMIPVDIHTHLKPSVRGAAIVNSLPNLFVPEEGEWYSVGFHPWNLTGGVSSVDWRVFEATARHSQVLAIGEAGLDKLIPLSLSVQEEVFKVQVEWAERLQKPLIIHQVKAVDELLRIKRELRSSVPWIIHGFRGKAMLAEMLVRHGFYLSFGVHYQAEAMKKVPNDKCFIESDESHVSLDSLYERAALVRGGSFQDLQETIRENIRAVFFKH